MMSKMSVICALIKCDQSDCKYSISALFSSKVYAKIASFDLTT